LLPGTAFAGAWIAPEGGQEIWTNAAGQRDELTYFETSAYIEAPIADRWSVVAAPWVEQNYDTPDGWRGEGIVGLKRAWTFEHGGALALQAGAFWSSHPGEGCGEGGGEARLLAGRALGAHGFVNVEAAGRLLSGGCAGERVDVTLGYRNGRWLGMAQLFVDAPDHGEESLKIQFAVARFGEKGRGIQLGVRARLDGEDAEPALVLALWGRPGD
jgi:hypothetical protein